MDFVGFTMDEEGAVPAPEQQCQGDEILAVDSSHNTNRIDDVMDLNIMLMYKPYSYETIYTENETYNALRLRFHKTGRGRPPDLPKGLTVTNELLVQLHFLKGQSYSYADLKRWLEDVEPNMSTVSEGRIRHRLASTLKQCSSFTSHEQLQRFLSASVDFNELPEPLASLGLTRLHFSNFKTYDQPPVENLTNSVIFELDKFRSNAKDY